MPGSCGSPLAGGTGGVDLARRSSSRISPKELGAARLWPEQGAAGAAARAGQHVDRGRGVCGLARQGRSGAGCGGSSLELGVAPWLGLRLGARADEDGAAAAAGRSGS